MTSPIARFWLVSVILAAASSATAATPTCTLTPSRSTIPAYGGLVTHTAVCNGAVSVTFRDLLGDVVTRTTVPFSVILGYGDNATAVTYTYRLEAYACDGSSPAKCASFFDTVTQPGAGVPAPVTAPACTAQVTPSSVAAGGATVTLSANCSGSAVGTATWRDASNAVVGQSTTSPYAASVAVAANGSGSARTLTYQLTACASADASKCATSSVGLSQAALPPAPAAPACQAQASPVSVGANGGVITLTASCSGSAVGSATWKDAHGNVLGQPSAAPYTLATSIGSNGASPAKTFAYAFTACTAAAPAACTTRTATVTQAAGSPNPSPVCSGSPPTVTRSQACPAGYVGDILEQQTYACSNAQWTGAGWATVQNSCTAAASNSGTAVEYYHAGLNHFFVTADSVEIAVLDAGQMQGWGRTGYSFKVRGPGSGGDSSPVCRYYGNAATGLNSHFYSAVPAECATVQAQWPGLWLLESSNVFQVVLPVKGDCPAGTVPVYRFFNNRIDANHRYVTDSLLFAPMLSHGYENEGLVFCGG